MISEKDRKNREELFKLMQENPELPVVPMVDGEIPGDDCGYWLGSWGQAQVDEYLEAGDHFLFKSDDDVFDALERYMTCEEFDALPNNESECRPVFAAMRLRAGASLLAGVRPQRGGAQGRRGGGKAQKGHAAAY